MTSIVCGKKLVQLAGIVLLTCSGQVRANECAEGMDATGNDCNGEQSARGISQADERLLYLKGAATMAALRSMQAIQRQNDSNADAKKADVELKAAVRALNEAEKAARLQKSGLSSKRTREVTSSMAPPLSQVTAQSR